MTLRRAIFAVLRTFAIAVSASAAIIIGLAISTGTIRAQETGDKYEIQRTNPSPLKAAGSRSRLPDRAIAGGTLYGCPARAWCGCWLAQKLGLHDRSLWVARNWISVGQPARRGCVGCVAVLRRGHGGHVGLVEGYERGNPIIKSGNHNNAVGTGVYPASRVLAYRQL